MAIRFAQPSVKHTEEPILTKAARPKHAGGRPKSENPKVVLNIRVDREVVEKFKATGSGWQSRINEVLKSAKIDDR